MHRLSSPLEAMLERYDVVVVGSGYGGGVASSRMARAGRSVCLLERGPERHPGEYPDTLPDASYDVQVDGPDGHLGSHTAMFDVRVNPDLNVLVGCGLGGTSLINANVSLPPDPRVFDDSCWPAALRADRETLLADGINHARHMLRPTPYPDEWRTLNKLKAHQLCADVMGQPFSRVPINVRFEDGLNHVGVEQRRCTLCGDCVTGCNEWAKNTTLMNYLPDAWNHGAHIFTHTRVRHVAREGDSWVVCLRHDACRPRAIHRHAPVSGCRRRGSGGRDAWLDGDPDAIATAGACCVPATRGAIQREWRRARLCVQHT